MTTTAPMTGPAIHALLELEPELLEDEAVGAEEAVDATESDTVVNAFVEDEPEPKESQQARESQCRVY